MPRSSADDPFVIDIVDESYEAGTKPYLAVGGDHR
jgi:hypothetical protein